MKSLLKFFYLPLALIFGGILLSSFLDKKEPKENILFPYQKAGLTTKQAALHLANRFTYGIKANDIDQMTKIGLEKWFLQQLNGKLADEALNKELAKYDAINLSNKEVADQYPKNAYVLRMAIKDGYLNKDSIDKGEKSEYRKVLSRYMQDKNFKPQQILFRQFYNQKILRASYSNNQLQEIMTEFWFNHFNVSMTKNDCAMYIPAYERDVIRPNVFGKFKTLLLATAKSPAMLYYLDNFNSVASNPNANMIVNPAVLPSDLNENQKSAAIKKIQENKKNQGLNENYAREVMELHTLGVDGGYTQEDVTQAAKILTGWTVYPFDNYGPGAAVRKFIDKIGENNLAKRGFVHEGDFLFAANKHDNQEKMVLGKRFLANTGYQEGVELLEMLAKNQATAKFITKKIAIRFVSDNPAQSLLDKMANTFLAKDGDIKQVLITMVNAPEFWAADALQAKTKSPFELAISAVRGLDADVVQPIQVYNWVTKMGQKMYYYQAPTGFPDKGQYWINTGALLNRMNFGLALAAQKIPGLKIDLAALNQNHEPESAQAALFTYAKILLPERDLSKTINRLTPMLNDSNLMHKVNQAANKNSVSTNEMQNKDNQMTMMEEHPMMNTQHQDLITNSSLLAQVVGVIIGSPEFQKR
jgi:uncharacterized protein (DUF1800 family)